MTITLITAGFLGLLLIILSFNVVRWRGREKINLGTGAAGSRLERAARAQANFVEYVPVMLVLLAALEFMQASPVLLLLLAVVFTVARCMHGYGLGFTDGSVIFWRFVGTLLTFICLLTASVAALVIGYSG